MLVGAAAATTGVATGTTTGVTMVAIGAETGAAGMTGAVPLTTVLTVLIVDA